jgi:hypothetical protein
VLLDCPGRWEAARRGHDAAAGRRIRTMCVSARF